MCRDGRCSVSTGTSCTRHEDCPLGPPGGDCARGHEGICMNDPARSRRCRSDDDCGGSPGACRKAACLGGEGAAIGFCECVVDGDCPQDTCVGVDNTDPDNPRPGHCFLSGRICLGQIDCQTIQCVQGGCLIGRNCAPNGDRRCSEL